jgi:hypothetical protein
MKTRSKLSKSRRIYYLRLRKSLQMRNLKLD